MPRTSATITQQEVATYAKFCKERGIINEGSADDAANADIVLKYFTETWPNTINEANLNLAWEALRPHLKLRSKAEQEWYEVAEKELDRAQQVAAWLESQGKVGQLVNTVGDEAYTNLRLLLETLRGYDINVTTIGHAIDRINHRPGQKLHFVQPGRRTTPLSQAAKNDDGTPFVVAGLTKQRDGSYGKSPADYAREAAQRSEKAAEPTTQRGPADFWETACNELLKFGTHGQQAAMRETHDRGISQSKSFREIHADMNALKELVSASLADREVLVFGSTEILPKHLGPSCLPRDFDTTALIREQRRIKWNKISGQRQLR
jgi:hypothetical protein